MSANPKTSDLTVGSTALYLLYDDGEIWSYDGSSWEILDDNPCSDTLLARDDELYQMHHTGPWAGEVWRHTGGFRRWENLGGAKYDATDIFGNVGTM